MSPPRPPLAVVPESATVEAPTAPAVRCAAKIEIEHVTWLWRGRIPAGMISILDGDPGLGKSTITTDLAARLSRGEPLPGDAVGSEPCNVLLVSHEEHPGAVMVPRLMAARADLARIFIWDMAARPFTLTESLGEMAALIEEHRIRLGVIDPLMASLPSHLNAHRDQDIRSVMSPIAALAERTGCAFLFVRHLNKSGGGSALYRGGGSIGIIGAARVGMLLARDPDAEDDDEARVLAVTKCNVARMAPSLRLRLSPAVSPAPGVEVARIVWGDPMEGHADELVQPQEERGEQARAIELINDLMASGSVHSADAQKALRANGISERTEARARKKLGVIARKDGDGPKAPWRWYRKGCQ